MYAVGSFPNGQIGRIDQIVQPGGSLISAAWHVAKWDGRNWNIVGSNLVSQFDPQFAVLRLNAIQVYDPDGPGGNPSVLVVGGVANGSSPSPNATLQFDGTSWTRFGQNLTSALVEEVRDLEIFNGELYACGRFAPSTGLTGVVKWDPTSQLWVDVGGGIPTTAANVRAERMAVGDAEGDGTTELYVSGTFTFSVTGGSAVKLVKWNGSNWSRVTGFTGTSTANQVNLGGPSVLKFLDIGDGPALLVGDAIYTGLASPANTRGVALARLKNGVWSTLIPQTGTASGTVKSYVYAAEMFPGPDGQQLHIGGSRLLNGVSGHPGGVRLARRSAAGVFSPLGQYGPDITGPNGAPAVRWLLPIDWDFAGPGSTKLLFGSIQFRGGTLGAFGRPNPAGSPAFLYDFEPQNIALWDGSAIKLANSGSGSLGVRATVIKELDPDGSGPRPLSLHIAHSSANADGIRAVGLVSFDGTGYQPYPEGLAAVYDFATVTSQQGVTTLYAAVERDTSNGPALMRLVGSEWQVVGVPYFDPAEFEANGVDAVATAVVNGEPSVIVSGRFRQFGNLLGTSIVDSRFVVRYNGTTLLPMDAGLPTPSNDPTLVMQINGAPSRVVSANGELFLNVTFITRDTVTSSSTQAPAQLYRWNGSSWVVVGPGEPSLKVVQTDTGEKLYSIRNYQPSGSDNSYVAEWNGTSFVQAGPGFQWDNPGGSRSNIQSLGSHDFGIGKRLVVVLDSPATSNGNPVSGLLYLDGGQWRQVPGGELLTQSPTLFSSANPAWGGLYVGGDFRVVNNNALNQNGVESQGIARFINGGCTTEPTRCSPADIAYGDGEPLPPIGLPGGFNPVSPDGGDFDCFFNFYFASAPDNLVCDIAYGDGEPLPPFGTSGGFNPGVDGGDFDCFFNYYFSGCL